ncbi:Hypothetical predicted protein [Cloeon dipterum]|uniref:Peptidase S1 domain-containing protein n=1 Tax=Cloeon dipterum TaxID=197152 RepID=A0A8S1E0E9_9INSE|nr:Hypothetical predicted protein [Cloeon dipterum]
MEKSIYLLEKPNIIHLENNTKNHFLMEKHNPLEKCDHKKDNLNPLEKFNNKKDNLNPLEKCNHTKYNSNPLEKCDHKKDNLNPLEKFNNKKDNLNPLEKCNHTKYNSNPLEKCDHTKVNYNPLEKWDSSKDNPNPLERFNVLLEKSINTIDHSNSVEVFDNNPKENFNNTVVQAYYYLEKCNNTKDHSPSDTDRFDSCGVSHEVTNLIINGDTVAKGAWPWLSAIYKVEETCFTFICGGTLVTKRHVVTAAHCVLVTQGRADLMQPEKILIFLGKYNILNIVEKDSKSKEISGITIHPKYTGRLDEYAGVDLAIITFKIPTTFGPYIKPVCLWDSTKQYARTGKVVGWGRDEYGRPSKAPKQVDMPIVTNEQCIKADPNFAKITSDTTFCAGFRNGSGPCKGDSGGGLYFWDQETRKWSIRGIVSQALLDHEKQSCDLKNYVTFTDVSKLLDWIKKMIQQ